MSTQITRDEWLHEFERVMRQERRGDPGFTTHELAAKLRVGEARASKVIKQAFDLGRITVGRKPGTARDGRAIMVPCYQLVRPKAAKKR